MTKRKVWWTCDQCPDGHPHKWLASVSNRGSGTGCPQCSGRRICQHNSLATKAPRVAVFWDENRNGRSAHMVVATSHQIAHWSCPVCQHKWTVAVATRVKQENGCPKCANARRHMKKKRHPTFAQSQHRLLAEWDYQRNAADKLFPDKVSLQSNKRVHWICNKCSAGQRHSWTASPNSRLGGYKIYGCPYCASKEACRCNSLQTHYPSIAAEWDYDMNDKTPNDYTSSSHREVWWRNSERGSWKQGINDRTTLVHRQTVRSNLAKLRLQE